VGPLQGVTLAPHSTRTYTFHVALASNVPVSKHTALMAFETYLDQIDPADGTGATLGDTYETQIKVPSEASTNNTRNLLLALAAGLLVVLSVLGLALWQRRQSPPQGPPAAPAAA
jgi:uncharacterized iron-regulated membrane protein